MMSRKDKKDARQSAARRWKTVFFGPDKRLRTGWWLAICVAVYIVLSLIVRLGLGALYAALFETWGINAANVHRAPGWARLIYVWHGSSITVAVSAAVIGASAGLRRLWMRERAALLRPGRYCGYATGMGMACAILSAALFLLLDSMRLEWPLSAPNLSAAMPALWIIALFGAFAEEAFNKGVVFDGVCRKWGTVGATVCACLLFFMTNGGYAGNVLCAVNVLLMGWVCCALYTRHGLWASVGFRWGWSLGSVFLLGFGNVSESVYRLYYVSDVWLTGGAAGPIYGSWMTFLLVALLLWLNWKRASHIGRNLCRRIAKAGPRNRVA